MIAGERFGRLKIVEILGLKPGSRHRRCIALCVCGNIKEVSIGNVYSGVTQSCGCFRREIGRNNKTHGLTGTLEYRCWCGIITRCTNPNTKDFKVYGARGISVCERWRKSFSAFLEDMGPKPSPAHSIDRIDSNGNYEPSNCKWSTQIEQANNTRRNVFIEIGGQKKTVSEWARSSNLRHLTLVKRINRGWTGDRLLIPSLRKTA